MQQCDIFIDAHISGDTVSLQAGSGKDAKNVPRPSNTNQRAQQYNNGVPRNRISTPECIAQPDRPPGYFQHFNLPDDPIYRQRLLEDNLP